MINLFSKYTDFLRPKFENSSLEEQKNANIVVFLIALTQVILLLFFPVNLLSGKFYAPINNIVAIGLLAINALYFNKTSNFKNTFLFYVLIILTLVSSEHLISPDHTSGNVLWLPILLFVSCYLLDRPRMIAAFLYGNTLFILAYTLPLYFNTPLDDAPPKDANLINIASLLFSSLATVFVAKNFVREEQLIKEKLKRGKELFKQISEKNVALLGILSHDISNPLMAASLRAEILKKESNSQDIEILIDQLKHIAAITNDVRKYAALGSGKIKLEPAPVDLRDTVYKAVKDQTKAMTEKSVKVEFEIPENEAFMVLAEPHSLRTTVFGNLISNAIKFSYPQSVIRIKAVKLSEKGQREKINVTIQDTGKGIPSKVAPHLFRFDSPTSSLGTNGEKGTGLGLPLVKMILETYNAEINIKSSDKGACKGTVITLSFFQAP